MNVFKGRTGTSSGRKARRDARRLAGIFDCTNHDTNEEGMWQ